MTSRYCHEVVCAACHASGSVFWAETDSPFSHDHSWIVEIWGPFTAQGRDLGVVCRGCGSTAENVRGSERMTTPDRERREWCCT
jgi:hypothetical protein